MAKTLVDFRAEKGLYLKDVAEKTGIPEDELIAVEQSGTVPAELGQKIIAHYALPADYFAEPVKAQIVKKNPSNPLTYFFGVSIVWSIITSIIASIPSYLSMLATSIFSFGFGGTMIFAFLASTPFKLFNSYFPVIVNIFSGIFLANFIIKKTSYTGDIKKYQFLYPILPGAPVLCVSMLLGLITQTILENSLNDLSFESSHQSMFALLGINGITFIVSIITSLLASFVCAKLLYSAAFDGDEKRRKLLRTIAIFATVSYALTAIMYVAYTITSDNYHLGMLIADVISYALGIALVWALALVKTDNKKVETVVYTVLPILAIIF